MVSYVTAMVGNYYVWALGFSWDRLGRGPKEFLTFALLQAS